MKPFRLISLPLAAAIIGLTLAFSSRAAESTAPMTANDLASRLSALRQDGASYVRLRMEIKGATKETLQLQIKERRTKDSSEVVYQVLYPKERKGESVLLRKIGNRPASGSVFVPPNTLRPIDDLKEPLLGSDLSYEDVVDNFFAWDQQAIVGTDFCQHVHVGFLVHGQIHIQYADGCTSEFVAPQVVAIEPGHDGWVVGDEPAVLVEFDFEGDTVSRLGMPKAHQHG